MAWTNEDGLTVRFNTERTVSRNSGGHLTNVVNTEIIDVNWEDIATVGSHIANIEVDDSSIPAGAYIKSATLIVTEAFTSGGSATLTIGLAEGDASTVIDADGIDATVAVAALGANAVVKCDGALAGGTASIGSDAGYVYFTTGTTAFTAGAAKLLIEYIAV